MPDSGFLLQSLTGTNLITGIFVYILVAFVVSLVRSPKYPTSIPWVGHGKGWVAGFKNTFDAITQSNQWVKDGYEQYNRKGRSYVLPTTFGMFKEIVVPRSQMQWMLDQPDSVLSTGEAHYDALHGDHSFIDKSVLHDLYHEHVIHKNLSRNLNGLIPGLSEEVIFNMQEVFGTDGSQWKSLNIMDMFIKIVPKLTNRMLVGEKLCRNPSYIESCVAFTMDVVRNMLLLGLTPAAMRAIVGPIASLPSKYHFHQATKHTYPVIRQRLEDLKRKDSGENKSWEEPNDYLTWHIRTAMAEGRSDMLEIRKIALCLMPLNFAAIHTTSLTGHSTLLDILSTDPKLDVLGSLREEAERIFREDGNEWTKAGLSRMYRIDSAIRESMRYSVFVTTMSARKVIDPKGITNPEEGWHAPYGTFLSCPLYGTQRDSEIYNGGDQYDAFRFSREREEYEDKAAEEKDITEGLRLRATGMVTTSDKHFPFGHGRHACPGRFFVAHELKMVIAYLVMNYDIKLLDKRPQPTFIARNIIPPTEARIEVRRRA